MTDIDMNERIHQSNLIEGIDDPRADNESLEAWDFLCIHDGLSHATIETLQRMITDHQTDLAEPCKGHYRDRVMLNVQVGSHAAPRWQRVRQLMDVWLSIVDMRTPWDNHVAFETIHPFADGNGRTGRMLMWWQELREGDEPTLIKAADRFDYYRALEDGRRSLNEPPSR